MAKSKSEAKVKAKAKVKSKDEDKKTKKAKSGKKTEAPEADEEESPKKGKKERRKATEVKSDVAPKAAYGKGLDAPTKIPGLDVDDVLDAIERKTGGSSTGMGKDVRRMSTGVLMLDLVLGGGLVPGWYTNFGKEQSCKSTAAMTILASALTQKVPILGYFDYEGSSEPTYLQNLMNTMGVKADISDVFGIRDRDGKFVKRPRVRYVPASTAEEFFDFLAMLLRKLPDKIFEGGQWWYAYENTNANRKQLADEGREYDKKKFTQHNKFYVPAEDGGLQALLVTDSYPAMLPERLDEDDAGAGLGAVARMFAEQIPRVKGKMKKKRVAVLGVNQLRDKPMVRHGSPEYEPGGNAVRFYSDVRVKFMARAVSAVKDAKQAEGTPFEIEPSIEFEESSDTYRYVSIKGEKNKTSQPYLTGFIRLWIQDGEGNARGFDPVYDTISYLRSTGQVKEEAKRKKMLLQIEGNPATKIMDWKMFKTLILGNKDQIKEICQKVGMKPMMVRSFCSKQIAKGDGLDMFFNARKTATKDDDGDM